MQVEISGHHMGLSDPIRSHVDVRCQRLEKHFKRIIHAHVVLSIEKERMYAEGTIRLRGKGTQIFAETSHKDMYAAIDALFDKLDAQLIRHKEKHTGHQIARSHGNSIKRGSNVSFPEETSVMARVLNQERVAISRRQHSKKSILEELSVLLTSSNESLCPSKAFECLLQRERIGCTSLGNGVALPHGRMEDCREVVAACIWLSKKMNYEADHEPVQLIFGVLAPPSLESEELHSQLLEKLARMFREERVLHKLRHVHSPIQLYSLLVENSP